MRAHPSIILNSYAALIAPVFKRLGSDEDQVNLEAADAFSGFAFALLSHPQDARKGAASLLREPLQSRIGLAFTKNPEGPSFVASIFGRLGPGDMFTSTRGIIRALIALANVVVIMGSDAFSHKATLTLIFKTLEHPQGRKLISVRLLHALVWQCLVWAFKELRAKEPPSSKIRRHAFKTIKQERRHGVAAILIASILAPSAAHDPQGDPSRTTHHDVEDSVTVLRGMAEDRESVRAEARVVLSRLTSAIGSAPTPPSTPAPDGKFFGDGILAKELFDSTILRASNERLSTLLPTLVEISTERVRPLTEPEIVGSWDGLVEVWITLVKKEILASQGTFSHPVWHLSHAGTCFIR